MTQAADLSQGTTRQPKRILIVDNTDSARRGLKALLAQSPDYEVVGEVANGQEVLQWVTQCPPDVIVMDINMPLMDGLTTTQYLRRQETPVKILLVSVSAAYRGAALAAGADVFVSKLEAPRTLLTALQELVSPET